MYVIYLIPRGYGVSRMISFTIAWTYAFPFQLCLSSSMMRESIFPCEKNATISSRDRRSPHHHAMIRRLGFSCMRISRCFPSAPIDRYDCIVTFSRRKSGFWFPIQNGRKRSITATFSSVHSVLISRMHSTVRLRFGRLRISYV